MSDEERRAEESARKLQDAAREARDTATAQAKSAEDRRFLRWGCKLLISVFFHSFQRFFVLLELFISTVLTFGRLVLAGGIVGTVVLATDLLTGPTLDELKDKASRAQRDYDGLLSLQREKKANFTRVKSRCSYLQRHCREVLLDY